MTSTTFKPGNKMSPPARHTSEFTEALRYFLNKQCGPKGLVGRPKKCTNAQSIVIGIMRKAAAGDLAAAKFLWERIEGAFGAMRDADILRDSPEISLKEAARRVGYLLLSQADPEDPETSVH